MTRYLLATTAMLALAACSGAGENSTEYDMAESAAEPAMKLEMEMPGEDSATADTSAEGTAGSPGEIPVSLPQIAYSYDYGFRVPAADIAKAQQAHVELCEKRGQKVCRVLNMSNSGGEGDYASGRLHVEVAADQARAFGGQLAKLIEEHGGSQIASSISGEDLSKQIVDTEARLRSRVLLSQRLTELLRTEKGSVKELVAAERAVT